MVTCVWFAYIFMRQCLSNVVTVTHYLCRFWPIWLPFMVPGRVAQLVGHLTHESEILGSIPSLATYFCFSADSRRAVVSYWRKYVQEVLVNRLEGLSLPRKSVVRLTNRPDMTLDVYCGCKTTTTQQQ